MDGDGGRYKVVVVVVVVVVVAAAAATAAAVEWWAGGGAGGAVAELERRSGCQSVDQPVDPNQAVLPNQALTHRVARLRAQTLHLPNELHALHHAAEHDVLVVEPRRLGRRDEELRAVRVGPRVGHREQPGLVVLQPKVLIPKLLTVDARAARAVAAGRGDAGRWGLRWGVRWGRSTIEPTAAAASACPVIRHSSSHHHPGVHVLNPLLSPREVAALNHELRNDAVEDAALEVEGLARTRVLS